jgi:hypothetical protein
MSQKSGLHRVRTWPRWTVILIGLGLAGLAIVLGLFLDQAVKALSADVPEPTPTMPTIAYSGALTESCDSCHFSLAALEASASDPEKAEIYLIEPESIATPHGRLGCIACHGGNGDAEGKESAHQGLVADMTAQQPEMCLICHDDMPSEIPGDRLRVPHGLLVEAIEQGVPCGVHCSDCHGGVGHGFDPLSGEKFCSMAVCLDCHQDQHLEIQMADCDACHLAPHSVPTPMPCSDCHTSTEVWNQVESGVHPVALLGKHGETSCFQCHQYPDFAGLGSECSDCHETGHANLGASDCAQCHDPAATWDAVSPTWDGHAEIWDQYKGAHLQVACAGCHFETYFDLDPDCAGCHDVPDSHASDRSSIDCIGCHQADQTWEP